MNPKRRAVIREIAFARRTMRGPTFGEDGGGQVDENQPEQGGGFVEPVQHAPATKPLGAPGSAPAYFLAVGLTGAVMGAVTGAVAGGKGRRARGAAIGAATNGALALGAAAILYSTWGSGT